MPKINPYYYGTSDVSKLGNSNMGKDDFLKLLITQLAYQNPLEPMDNRELVAQMAQFSSLEQMQNMNQQIAGLSAINALGKNAKAINENQQEVVGIVTGVTFEKGKTCMTLEVGEGDEIGEIKLPMESIFEIR